MSRRDHRKAPKEGFRTFICIEIPDSIKQRIETLQAGLRAMSGSISWTRPANVHVTIKFLGPVAASRMPALQQAAERASASIESFDLTVGGTGCFPSPRNARVLWVGLQPVPEELDRLYSNLESELEGLGFPRESKRFSPHLTIARVRDTAGARAAVDQFLLAGFAVEGFRATRVIVMRSELHPSGSIYTPLWIIPLARS